MIFPINLRKLHNRKKKNKGPFYVLKMSSLVFKVLYVNTILKCLIYEQQNNNKSV